MRDDQRHARLIREMKTQVRKKSSLMIKFPSKNDFLSLFLHCKQMFVILTLQLVIETGISVL